jgi:hypothetical protein
MFDRPIANHASSPTRARRSALAAELRGAKPQREGGWLESSWDLSHGLEISDLEGDLPEEFLGQLSAPGN